MNTFSIGSLGSLPITNKSVSSTYRMAVKQMSVKESADVIATPAPYDDKREIITIVNAVHIGG